VVEIKKAITSVRAVVNFVKDVRDACANGDMDGITHAMMESEIALGKSHTAVKLTKKGLIIAGPALQAKAMADALICEAESDELRSLLRRYGFTDDAIITVVFGSTFVLVLILVFIYTGYTVLVPDEDIDLLKSIVTSIGVLGASIGVSKGNAPKDDGGRSIMLIVNFLVDEWKKQQGGDSDSFVFDSNSEALGTLKKAHAFHKDKD